MTVPLEVILAELSEDRRKQIEESAQALIEDHYRRVALRKILRYDEHPGTREGDGSNFDVFLGEQRIAIITYITVDNSHDQWSVYFHENWSTPTYLGQYDLPSARDHLETAILAWFDRLRVMPQP